MPAWIAAGAAIGGDIISQIGQQGTNAQAAAIAAQNNATAIDLAKNQITYRVEDYKRAGLNPMLAAGGPGMSLPSLMQPNLQNPSQAFGGAGGQFSSAMQLGQQQASIDLARAQANKANAEAQKTAGVDTDLSSQNILESQSRQALQSVQADAARAQASLSSAQAQVAQATLPKIQAEIRLMGSQSDLASAKANVENINSMLGELDIQQKTAIMPSIIESAHNAMLASHLDLFEKQAMAEFFASGLGQASPAISTLVKTVVGTRAVLR